MPTNTTTAPAIINTRDETSHVSQVVGVSPASISIIPAVMLRRPRMTSPTAASSDASVASLILFLDKDNTTEQEEHHQYSRDEVIEHGFLPAPYPAEGSALRTRVLG